MIFKHLVAAALVLSPAASLAQSVPTPVIAPAAEEVQGSELRGPGRGDFVVVGLFVISAAIIIAAVIKILEDDNNGRRPVSP